MSLCVHTLKQRLIGTCLQVAAGKLGIDSLGLGVGQRPDALGLWPIACAVRFISSCSSIRLNSELLTIGVQGLYFVIVVFYHHVTLYLQVGCQFATGNAQWRADNEISLDLLWVR